MLLADLRKISENYIDREGIKQVLDEVDLSLSDKDIDTSDLDNLLND